MIEIEDIFFNKLIDKEKPSQKVINTFHGLESVSFYDIIVLEKEIPKDFKRLFSQ